MKGRTVLIGTAAGLTLSGLGGYGIASARQDEKGPAARYPAGHAPDGTMADGGKSGRGAGGMHDPMMGRAEMRRMHRSMMRDPESRRLHGRAMKSPGMRAMHREMHGLVR